MENNFKKEQRLVPHCKSTILQKNKMYGEKVGKEMSQEASVVKQPECWWLIQGRMVKAKKIHSRRILKVASAVCADG